MTLVWKCLWVVNFQNSVWQVRKQRVHVRGYLAAKKKSLVAWYADLICFYVKEACEDVALLLVNCLVWIFVKDSLCVMFQSFA